MLPKTLCLKNKKDFEKVFKIGSGFKEDFLYLKFAKNNLKNSRFGFVVSKKFSNKAVVRNKIKRRLRSLIEINLDKIKKGVDCIIIVRPGLEITDFWDLEKKIDKLFKKARILK
jgi:ribonuclease P protein component